MALAKPWVAATNIAVDADGRPINNSPAPFILAAIAMLLVASMMRHTFALSGLDTLEKGLMLGLGLGLFLIGPWIMINNVQSDRPFRLTLIDGGYPTFGSAVMRLVLMLF